jgi:hypothetical protein
VAYFTGGKFALGGFFAVATATVPAVVLAGIPLFQLYRRRGWLTWWGCGLGGGLAGGLCATPYALVSLSLFARAVLPLFLCLGFVHGLAFWVLAIWRNTGLTARSTRTHAGGPSAPPRGPVNLVR